MEDGLGGVVEGMANLSTVEGLAGGAEVSTGGGQVGKWADNYFKVKHFTRVVSTCTCTCGPWWGRLCTVVVWLCAVSWCGLSPPPLEGGGDMRVHM